MAVRNVEPQIINRLTQNDWVNIGNVKHSADTRTPKQILETVEGYIKRFPEVSKFMSEIKAMKPKYMGLIADTLELSGHTELRMNAIDLNKEIKNTCARDEIIKEIINAAKNNPEALDLVEAVINNTDTIASKYTLIKLLNGILQNKEATRHVQETAKIVPQIAQETLSGGYLGTYEKENNFVNMLFRFINPHTKLDKITSLFDDIVAFTEKRPENFPIYMDRYLESDTPLEKIRENLRVLPQVLDMRNNKSNFDIVEFVTRNTNIK